MQRKPGPSCISPCSQSAERQSPVYVCWARGSSSAYLNSSVANGKALRRNVALPEGHQALLLEDALHRLQDAMILSSWVSGGELLYLKLEKEKKPISSSTSHFNWFKRPVRELTTPSAPQR